MTVLSRTHERRHVVKIAMIAARSLLQQDFDNVIMAIVHRVRQCGPAAVIWISAVLVVDLAAGG